MNFNRIKYTILLVLLLGNFVFIVGENRKAPEDSVSFVGSILRPIVGLSDSIVKFGKTFINTPYHFGSQSGLSFDCSGFTSFVYNSFGYKLDHSSAGQAGQYPEVDTRQLKTGDLVYFSGHRKSRKHIGHVGMVVSVEGDGKFNFIHAATSRGITISSSEEPYYKQRFIKANRVIGSNPLVDGSAYLKTEKIPIKAPIPFNNDVVQTTKIIPAKYHKVKRGETLKSIAKLYGVGEKMLISLNHLKGKRLNKKQLLKVTEQESVLVAESTPKPSTSPSTINVPDTKVKMVASTDANKLDNKPTTKTHLVQKGETMFGIAAKYGLTVSQLMELNNIKNNGLQAGQELMVSLNGDPSKKNIPQQSLTDRSTDNKKISHEVKKGETLYSIATKYNVDVKTLGDFNKITDTKIVAGQTLQIPSANQVQALTPISEHSDKSKPATKKIYHTVKSGETLTSIAEHYDCSVDDVKSWNKRLGKRLLAGVKLRLYSNNN